MLSSWCAALLAVDASPFQVTRRQGLPARLPGFQEDHFGSDDSRKAAHLVPVMEKGLPVILGRPFSGARSSEGGKSRCHSQPYAPTVPLLFWLHCIILCLIDSFRVVAGG